MSNEAQVRAQIEAALESGVTAGPWRHNKDNEQIGDVTLDDGGQSIATATRASAGIYGWKQRDKDAAYIAACNPANIRTLLDDHDAQLRAANERIAALRDASRDLATIAFNLSQHGGRTLEKREAEFLAAAYKKWDAALATLPSGASQ